MPGMERSGQSQDIFGEILEHRLVRNTNVVHAYWVEGIKGLIINPNLGG